MVLEDFQEKKEIERSIFSWPVIIIVLALCLAAVFGIARSLKIELSLNGNVENLKKKIAEAEASRKSYEEKLAGLKNPAGLDLEARGKFNLKKPGEEVVLFVDDTAQPGVGAGAELGSFLEGIKKFFGF